MVINDDDSSWLMTNLSCSIGFYTCGWPEFVHQSWRIPFFNFPLLWSKWKGTISFHLIKKQTPKCEYQSHTKIRTLHRKLRGNKHGKPVEWPHVPRHPEARHFRPKRETLQDPRLSFPDPLCKASALQLFVQPLQRLNHHLHQPSQPRQRQQHQQQRENTHTQTG